MFTIPSYGKVYILGHKAISQRDNNLFDGEVSLQEKIDGSNAAFIKVGDELFFRSKNRMIPKEDPGMFLEFVQSIEAIKDKIQNHVIYRGEYLQKPQHHTLKYDRVPNHHFIVFDVQTLVDEGHYQNQDRETVQEYCKDLFETVPEYKTGISSFEEVKEFMDRDSCLGGCRVEGVVVKNYKRFTSDGKPMMGKFVSDEFKEKKVIEWGSSNPSRTDILHRIVRENATEARFRKSIQHAAEEGKLDNSPRDIGMLMKMVKDDIDAEEAENIKNQLYNFFKSDILRAVVKNFPSFYKEELAKRQFDSSSDTSD